jgi:RNA polymerase sigma-70 factor, ECF subfamily
MAAGVELTARWGAGLGLMDDESLARALIAGEPAAATIAWQRFSPMVRRIVRRAIGPGGEVEDLVQNVFLRLFTKVHALREPKVLKAFVITITTFTLRQELRRRRLRSWLGLRADPTAFDLRVVHPDPLAREALTRFYRLLDRFGARDRTAFVLRFLEGMDLTEVAAALGVSLATAKRCIARAQERMLTYVERDPALREYLTAAFGGRADD